MYTILMSFFMCFYLNEFSDETQALIPLRNDKISVKCCDNHTNGLSEMTGQVISRVYDLKNNIKNEFPFQSNHYCT